MFDTIDLLEAIGRDASLRHASADELAKMLEAMPESDAGALASAVASGDTASLSAEFGSRHMFSTQATQGPGHEEEEEYEEDTPVQEDEVQRSVPDVDRE
ncbi:MAG TPA: hypothetical protein VN813_08285 [Luteibacter sp.]|nr:hypothetical protein [Luteibacter sp.]